MVKGLKDKNKKQKKFWRGWERKKKKKNMGKCLLTTSDQKESISPKKLSLNPEGRLRGVVV